MACCSDELVWLMIRHGYCSFRVKMQPDNMCRNPYNLTGLCSHMNCPLANSRYATVLEEEGKLYLMTKTIERAHMPSKQWEKSELSSNLKQAMQQISNKLAYWPSHIVAKCKARYVKLTQMLIRMRRIALNPRQMEMVRYHKKSERREAARARKAEGVAMLDQQIKKELFSRLLKGTYPTELIDLDKGVKDLVAKHLAGKLPTEEQVREREQRKLREAEQEIDEDMGTEFVEGDYDEDEDDDDEYFDDEDDDDDERKVPDLEDLVAPRAKRPRTTPRASKKRPQQKRKGPRVEIEYENEQETEHQTADDDQ